MDEYYKSPTVEKIVLVVVGVRWPWLERHGPIQRNFGAVDGELGVVVDHLGHYISRQDASGRLEVVKVLELKSSRLLSRCTFTAKCAMT